MYLWFSRRECFLRGHVGYEGTSKGDGEFENVYITKAYSNKNVERLKASAVLGAGATK